jgi:hypothetical protein
MESKALALDDTFSVQNLAFRPKPRLESKALALDDALFPSKASDALFPPKLGTEKPGPISPQLPISN